jgi:hypothetical protein
MLGVWIERPIRALDAAVSSRAAEAIAAFF